ncbi:hypothetical protein JCM11251_003883 [Rhodosporidiobolus azoricus]
MTTQLFPAGRVLHRSFSIRCYATARPSQPKRPRRAEAAVPPPVEPQVVYENEQVLVLNKPAGVALQGVHGSAQRLAWDQLLDAIRKRDGCAQASPVHRLDKATTGCLVLSKTPVHAARLTKQIQQRAFSKDYLAVVHGQIKEGFESEVDAPLRMDGDRVRVAEDGVEAKTRWECLSSSKSFSLLRLKPSTGRKHQLRVHCADVLQVAAPIVGDFKIAPSAPHASALSDISLPFSTLLLHASSVSFFAWEKTGKRYTISASAPPPPSFLRFCKAHKLQIPVAEPVKEV